LQHTPDFSRWSFSHNSGLRAVPAVYIRRRRRGIDLALAHIQGAQRGQSTRLIVVAERTRRYHHIPQRLFAAHGNEVSLAHPFTLKKEPSTASNG
jgi:hypothetical protein